MASLSALHSFQVNTASLTFRASLPIKHSQNSPLGSCYIDPSPVTVAGLECSKQTRSSSPPATFLWRWSDWGRRGEQRSDALTVADDRPASAKVCDSLEPGRVVLRSSAAAVLALVLAGSGAELNESVVRAQIGSRPSMTYVVADAKGAVAPSGPAGQVGGASPTKSALSLALTSAGAIGFSILWIAELQNSRNIREKLAAAKSEGQQKDTRLVALRATMREELSAMEERVQQQDARDEPEQVKQLTSGLRPQGLTSEALTAELQSYSNVIPALRQQVSLLESELSGTLAERSAISSRLAEAETKERALVEYAGLADRRVRELERLVGLKQREISAQRRDMSAMQDRMERYRSEIASLESAQQELSDKQRRSRGAETTGAARPSKPLMESGDRQLAAVQGELTSVLKELEKVSGEVEECRRALAAKEASLRGYETQASQKADEVKRLQREVDRLKGERRELEYLKTRVEELTSELMKSRTAAASR